MISDRERVAAYSNALRKAVRPGCIVGEIGAGTGVFSMLACQLGARRVYAIEADPIFEVGREIVFANGFGDRITFIQDMSTRVELPERCDVIVSEIHGILPWFEMHIPSIVDARERMLASGGILIPQSENLWAAIVEAPELHSFLLDPWTRNPFGFDMRTGRQIATNSWQKARVKPEQLITEPKCFATLDYMTVTDPQLNAGVTWEVSCERKGTGFVAWFDSILCDGVQLSNSPFTPELIFGSAFFPWPEEIKLKTGDKIELALSAHLISGDYIWRWETTIFSAGNSQKPSAQFDQSTFSGTPLSLKTIHKRNGGYTPSLNDEGQIDQFILSHLDGRTSLQELAGRLVGKFPSYFESLQTALNRVADCSQKYGR
ncbi:MAG TPA: 50S ribosomal protein L11 methyltransferase [Candidatus Saccharimonadales bacterium]|nr:50S ribosomal protein L11 methyltransferase [Candidatus Saccharimonadales bacterium]